MAKNKNGREGWFLGIDLGTGSCKSVIICDEKILGFGTGDYQHDNIHSSWNEQNPEAVLEGMIRSVHHSLEDAQVNPSHCLGIGLGGALHSLLAVDRAGQPMTGILTWADGRAASQAQFVRKTSQAASLYDRTGCPAHAMYPLYKIRWLREENTEIIQKVARYISAKEYIFEELTGQEIVDYGLASGSGLFNIHTLDWDPLALDLAGIRLDQLSQIASPLATFNKLKPEMAKALKLPIGTPITLGSSDAASSNFGAGAVSIGQATCMIGTSGAFRVIAPQPILDPNARLWCYAIDESHWLVGGAINNGGIAFSWLKDAINKALTRLPEQKGASFEDFIKLAEQTQPGADGLVCLPFFAGERSPNWNMNARAVFFGLTLQHDVRHLARAILEGVAYRLRSISEILSELTGEIREVRASGGFTHSYLWPQIVSSVLNQELQVPAWGETSSLGAAFWAMLAAGALTSIEDASRLVQIENHYQPIPTDAAIYQSIYHIYTELYQSLCPILDHLAEIHP